MLGTARSLAVTSWSLYSLGVCLIIARLPRASRLITFKSLARLQSDDWVMCALIIPFTAMVITANGSLESDDSFRSVANLQMRIALEELNIITSWSIKACLIILYLRIFPPTTSRRERRLLTYASAYCLLSFLCVQILLPVWCTPFQKYWSQQAQNPQCGTYRNHSILMLAFDITSVMMSFVIPVFFIPTPLKILQVTLASLGLLVLISSILSRYTVVSHPRSTSYTYWYNIEITLMLVFANLPFLSSLFKAAARYGERSTTLHPWPRSWKWHLDHPFGRRTEMDTSTLETTLPSFPKRSCSTMASLRNLEAEYLWKDFDENFDVVIPRVAAPGSVAGRI